MYVRLITSRGSRQLEIACAIQQHTISKQVTARDSFSSLQGERLLNHFMVTRSLLAIPAVS